MHDEEAVVIGYKKHSSNPGMIGNILLQLLKNYYYNIFLGALQYLIYFILLNFWKKI